MIQVIDYHKTYGDTVAVRGLSFAVPSGAILGLVGANGAGKTTTLRALAGIIPPTLGQLRICGHDVVRECIAAKSKLAYVPDDPKLFDELTVWEHMQFVAATYRVTPFESMAQELLTTLELTEKRDAPAQSLSRGMRQKVAIACAYLHSPAAILLDEPMTGLDPHGIRTFKESLKIRAKGGAAIVLSSHLLSAARRLRLPQFPWLFGAGPNLWRQWILLSRRSHFLIVLFGAIVVVGVLMVLLTRRSAERFVYLPPLCILGGLAYQSLLAAMQLPAAFRGDVDRMDWLKSLPLQASATVWGEIGGVVLLLSLLQALLLAGAWGVYQNAHEAFAAGLVLLLPMNLLIFGIENMVFLLFPVRNTTVTAGDFQFLGKFFLLTILKMTLTAVGLAIAATGGIVYLIIPNLWVAAAAGLVLLAMIDVFVLYLATLAFLRFDVSQDTPPP